MSEATDTGHPPRRPSTMKGWGPALGIGIAAVLHCALFGVAVLLDTARPFCLIGVVQIAYLGPA